MLRPAERCIYCGDTASLTKEHIFGKWIKKHVGTRSPKTEHLTSFQRRDPETNEVISSVGRGRLNRNGSPHSVQLKIACEECNNGWMSVLQDSAQPLLSPLIAGKWPDFDLDAVRIIASWATMVTMCLEFADLNTIATTEDERGSFKAEQSPAKNWQVFAGLCLTDVDPGSFWHRAVALYDKATERVPEIPNTQTTTFYLGHSFFHVVSARFDRLYDPAAYAARLGIRQFWPATAAPPSRPLHFTVEGVNRVATEFWRQFDINIGANFGLIDGAVPAR